MLLPLYYNMTFQGKACHTYIRWQQVKVVCFHYVAWSTLLNSWNISIARPIYRIQRVKSKYDTKRVRMTLRWDCLREVRLSAHLTSAFDTTES